MTDQATPAATPTATPQATPQGDLTLRGAADQLVAERRVDPARPAPPAAPQPPDDRPDPADLAALEADESLSEQQPPEQPQQRFRLPDGTEATLQEVAEWRRGNMRQQDYTRKTQELANYRRTFEQQMGQFHQNMGAYASAVDNAIAVASHYLPKAPSDELRKSDFYSWQEQKAEYDSKVGELQSLHQQRQYLQQVEQQKQQEAWRTHIARQQHALLTARPDLRDPAKAVKYSQDVKAWAIKNGFSAQEATSVQDARLLLQIEKAMKWDKLQEHKARMSEKEKNAVPMQPVQTPSRRVSQAERDNASVSTLRKRFEEKSESGSMASIRDAAALLTAERTAAARRNR